MVNSHGMISVGVDVNPEQFNVSEWKDKTVSIGVDYKVTMADIIITISEHSEKDNQEQIFNQNYQVYEDVKPNGDETQDVKKINISRSSRPTCRRNRTECDMHFQNITSTIPSINPVSLKPCKYYRHHFLNNEGVPIDWTNYSALQKLAGQKVINKIALQQKMLEAEANEAKRKETAGKNNSDNHEHIFKGSTNPILKKKVTRLEPLNQKSHNKC